MEQSNADDDLVSRALGEPERTLPDEEQGHPGLKQLDGRLYVDADGDKDALQELWQETLRRSPVTQSLLREVPVQLQLRRV